MKGTKRKLILSLMAMLVCATMLIGTTFAWFTDTASSQANKIQAGTLDVVLYEKQGNDYVLLDDERPVFDYDKWEPGFTAVEELLIKNEGSLALRYQVKLQGLETLDAALTKGIENVLEVSINDTPRGTLADFADGTNALLAGALIPAEDNSSVGLKIQIHMREDAGNEYQAAVLPDFDILVTAAQYTYESDSFDNQYDAAALPEFSLEVYVPVAVENNAVAETVIQKENVTVTVPPTVLVGGEPLTAEKTLKLAIKSTTTDPVFEAAAGTGNVASVDIALTDIEGNPVTAAEDPIPVVIPLAPGLLDVTVLHNGVAMAASDFSYNAETGVLTIYATSFSPYTIGYNTKDDITEWSRLAETAWYDDNTAATTFTINTPEDFAGLAKLVNRGVSFSGKTVTLGANINLAGKVSEIIGGGGKRFAGTFDGNGYTISKATIASRSYGTAIFGDTVGATFKNFTVDGAVIGRRGAGNIVGGVVGYAYGSPKFENVHVKNTTVYGYGKVGGILGQVSDPQRTVTMTNCSVEKTKIISTYNSGGLIGQVLNGVANLTDCTVDATWEPGSTVDQYVTLDTTIACEEGAAASCPGAGTAVKGHYWVYAGYYWGGYAKYYVLYGSGSHDCALTGTDMLLANSELVIDSLD